MKTDTAMREEVVNLLNSMARMSIKDAVADFPMKHINTKPPNVEYSFWHLLEHIRRTQKDILDYMRDPNYKEPMWPRDYWPARNHQATKRDWERTIKGIEKDLIILIRMAEDPNTDLFKIVPDKNGASIYHELLMVGDHNAYHIGEFSILRQVVSTWPKNRKG